MALHLVATAPACGPRDITPLRHVSHRRRAGVTERSRPGQRRAPLATVLRAPPPASSFVVVGGHHQRTDHTRVAPAFARPARQHEAADPAGIRSQAAPIHPASPPRSLATIVSRGHVEPYGDQDARLGNPGFDGGAYVA
jgi:hypothetical protein